MSFDIAPVKDIYHPNQIIADHLDKKDIARLLCTSKDVRNNTIAVLPAQKQLWEASRFLSVENIKTALRKNARVNKIERDMNAFAIVEKKHETAKLNLENAKNRRDKILFEQKIKASEEILKILREKGGKPLKLEDLNNDLIDCVKRVAVFDSDSDSYSDLLKRIEEALLDGADPNTRTTYSEKLSDNKEKKKEGGLLHVLTVQSKENKQLIVDTIKQLKKFGIDMNQVDKKLDDDDDDDNDVLIKHLGEETALHYACTAHLRPGINELPSADFRLEIVRALLESGIDVNKQNSEGDTALHLLVRHSREPIRQIVQDEDVKIVKLLLSSGADVSIENMYESTVFDSVTPPEMDNILTNAIPIWSIFINPELVNILNNAKGVRENFINAVQEGNVNEVQNFIEKGAPVNTVIFSDESGFIPILFESFGNFYKENISEEDAMAIVELLLDQPQSNVNVVDSDGNTVIMTGLVLGTLETGMQDWRVDCVRMLIEKGIDLKIKNNLGKNIWYLLMKGDRANRFEQHPNGEIIDLVRNALECT